MPRILLSLSLIFCFASCRKAPEPEVPPPAEHPEAPGAILETNRDAEAVFQRAFWRAPTPDDEILHAERREWVSDDDGVRRWQWFLAVKPGQTLNDWLRQENPFLTSAIDPGDYQPPTSSPSWFPSPAILARSEIQRHGANGITLIFDTQENHLYATDSGGGFRQSSPTE